MKVLLRGIFIIAAAILLLPLFSLAQKTESIESAKWEKLLAETDCSHAAVAALRRTIARKDPSNRMVHRAGVVQVQKLCRKLKEKIADLWNGRWRWQSEVTKAEKGEIGWKSDREIVIRREGNKLVWTDSSEFTLWADWTDSSESTWRGDIDGSRVTGRWEYGTLEFQLSSDGKTFSGTFTGENSDDTWGGEIAGTKLDDR